MANKYGRGLVVGKFAPPHNGHHYLIERALDQADQVWILVVDSPVLDCPISATDRALILNEVHPGVIAKVMPDIEIDDNSEYWAEYTQAFLGFTPDAVFTSEDYGNPWSEALGCHHVMVDYPRAMHSVSATMVRNNPLDMAEWMKPITRTHFIKRVVVHGAESTGTTTLAKALAEHYRTEYVPEFGRIRDEAKVARDGTPYDWPSEDFYYTALMQQAMEDQAAQRARKVLICDTDAFATHLWEQRYLGKLNPRVLSFADDHAHKKDLYIITSPEGVEPEDDGLRFNMHERQAMHERFMRLHLGRTLIVEGPHEDRLKLAIEEIDQLLGG